MKIDPSLGGGAVWPSFEHWGREWSPTSPHIGLICDLHQRRELLPPTPPDTLISLVWAPPGHWNAQSFPAELKSPG